MISAPIGSILVIGCGNPLRGDDAVGWHAVQMVHDLKTAGAFPHGTLLKEIAVQQLAPELSEDVSRAAAVIFVDAAAEGVPGSVCIAPVAPIDCSSAYGHTMLPETVLGLSRTLFGRSPETYLVTVAGESFTLGERLSPVVEGSLEELRNIILNLILHACPAA